MEGNEGKKGQGQENIFNTPHPEKVNANGGTRAQKKRSLLERWPEPGCQIYYCYRFVFVWTRVNGARRGHNKGSFSPQKRPYLPFTFKLNEIMNKYNQIYFIRL